MGVIRFLTWGALILAWIALWIAVMNIRKSRKHIEESTECYRKAKLYLEASAEVWGRIEDYCFTHDIDIDDVERRVKQDG